MRRFTNQLDRFWVRGENRRTRGRNPWEQRRKTENSIHPSENWFLLLLGDVFPLKRITRSLRNFIGGKFNLCSTEQSQMKDKGRHSLPSLRNTLVAFCDRIVTSVLQLVSLQQLISHCCTTQPKELFNNPARAKQAALLSEKKRNKKERKNKISLT